MARKKTAEPKEDIYIPAICNKCTNDCKMIVCIPFEGIRCYKYKKNWYDKNGKKEVGYDCQMKMYFTLQMEIKNRIRICRRLLVLQQ